MLFSNNVLGIDIDYKTIKMVEYSQRNNKLLNFQIVSTPQGAVNNGKIESPEMIGEKLRQVLKTNRIKTKRVVSGISGKNVLSRYLILPHMSEQELKEAINWETKDYLSFFSDEEVVTDFQVIEEIVFNDIKQSKILFVAVPYSISQKLLESFQAAGLKPVAFEVNALSLLRVFKKGYPQNDNQISAVIDIGIDETNMIIVYKGNLRLNRTINMGSENLKETIRPNHLSNDSVEDFIEQVRRFINFYRSQNRGAEVQEIYLCGEGLSIEGLKEVFEQNFNISIKLLDPFKNIDCSPHLKGNLFDKRYMLVNAVGMALRG